MALVSQDAQEFRRFFTTEFAPSYPGIFRALQDFAVAGADALKNNGKRAWFGFGRDLSLESARKYQDAIALLAMSCEGEGYLMRQEVRGISVTEQVDRMVTAFFRAYPNWPDAEAAWDVVGRKTMDEILRSRGY